MVSRKMCSIDYFYSEFIQATAHSKRPLSSNHLGSMAVLKIRVFH